MKKSFENYSKEELILEIEKLYKRKKYGLVWETKNNEEVVELCKKNIPILKEEKNKEIIDKKNKNYGIFIEGDNFHSLAALNYTHEKKIDFIYIDPPYNTGDDWKYKNDYVNKDDPFRHSQWISFMYNRLKLAKSLLKEDGIICVTIDNNELPRLWLLMDEIFKSKNFLGEVIIRNNPASRNVVGKIALTHEYALFFGKSSSSKISKIDKLASEKSHKYIQDNKGKWYSPTNLRKTGVDNFGLKKDGTLHHRHYPIYVDPKSKKISTSKKYKIKILPINEKGEKVIWRRGKEDISKMFEDGLIFYNKTSSGDQIFYKHYGDLAEAPKSIWTDSKFSASEYGTPQLNDTLGKKSSFPFPKSPYAVEECIKIGCNKKNAIILDFFAGSGTTAQAVINLNKKDNGSRSLIICTNNEKNIAKDDTYPRIKNLIKGYKSKKKEISGAEMNLKYFTTSFVERGETDKKKFSLAQNSTDLICIKENSFKLEAANKDKYKIFSAGEKFTFILFDQSFIDEIKKLIPKYKGYIKIYIFSLGNDSFQEEFEDFKNVETESFPDPIISVYNRLFN